MVILYTSINRRHQNRTQLNFVTVGLGSDGCQHYYIAVLLAIQQITEGREKNIFI